MNGPLNITANSPIDGLEITQSGAGNGLHVTGTTDLVGNTTLTGNLDVSGTASATNVSLPDDGVLSLGTSDELTLKHHNSGYSHLINTTGTLFIDSDSVTFRDDDGSPSNMVVSQTGVDVTGTVTADGLTVDGDATISDTTPSLLFMESDTTDVNTRLLNNGGDFFLSTINDAKSSVTNRLSVDHATGDISFYSSDGNSQALFWDASAESLGIGTSSLTTNATLSVAQGGVHVDGGASGGASQVILSTGASSGSNFGQISNTGTRWALGYGPTQQTKGTEVLTWDGSGLVGIGGTPATARLEVTGAFAYASGANSLATTVSKAAARIRGSSDASTSLFFGSLTNDAEQYIQSSNGAGDAADDLVLNPYGGNVGIGTSSPTSPLTVTKDAGGIATFTGISSGGVSSVLMKQSRGSIASPSNSATAGDGNYILGQVYNSGYATIGSIGIITGSALNNGEIQFNTASSGTVAERMRITSAGALQLSDVNSPNDINTAIYSNSDVLEFEAFGTNGAIAFSTGSGVTEAARFDSSQNFLVGTTSTDTAAVGFRYRKSLNAISSVADGGISAYFGRRSSDGDIVTFRKDDATVGSIGVNDDKIIFGTANAAIAIDQSSNIILPYNPATPGARDAAIDLGYASGRFKDLYLSGGVVFGATGGAVTSKTLDDYEEGSYDCTISCGTSGTISLNGSFNRAAYTKVGRLVTVHGFIVVSAVSSPVGFFNITLPFTPASLPDRAGDSTVDLVIQNVVSANISDFVGTINEGDARIYVQLGDNTAIQNDSAQQIAANTYIHFSTTYSTV